MKSILLSATVLVTSLCAFADASVTASDKTFNCIAIYRDTLSIKIKSADKIWVSNQFSDQVTYTPSDWVQSEVEKPGSFVLTSSLSAVLKSWDNVEQKWMYIKMPETKITIEFENNEPVLVTSSFMNLKCNQEDALSSLHFVSRNSRFLLRWIISHAGIWCLG